MRPLARMINTKSHEDKELMSTKWEHVKTALFSPDEQYLVLITSFGAYSYSVDSGKQRHRWEEKLKGPPAHTSWLVQRNIAKS